MSDTTPRNEISAEMVAILDAEKQRRVDALAADAQYTANVLNAKVGTLPKGARRQLRAMQTAAENQRRAERQARIATSAAKKTGVPEMHTVTKRADETAAKPAVAARSERAKDSNVTPLWPAAKAVDTIMRAHAEGYFPVTVMPSSLKDKNAGKRPALFDRGSWGGWHGWETQVQTASLATLTDWNGQTNSVPNVGVLCGTKTEGGFVIGVDIDCEAPELVEAIAKLAGGVAIRKGRQGRSGLIPLVVNELSEQEKFTCGEDTIQLLREGKQFVAAGIHPTAKQLYRWEDTDELPVAMPALAELPRVKMADLVRVLSECGFLPSSTSASKPASSRKAELLAELRGSELNGDSFDELFVNDGAPFPLAELRAINPAFDRLYAKYENGVDDPESVSHNGNRVATSKDFLRRWPEHFTIEHAAVFGEVWPGAGERVEKKEAKGQWDDERQVNAFAAAEAGIKAERAGDVKQHASTRLAGDGFGAIEEDDNANEPVANETEADKANADEAQAQRLAERAADKRLKKLRELAANTTWYQAATNIPRNLTMNAIPPRAFIYGSILQLGHATLLSASGGVGKSVFALAMAIDLACGVDHLGAGPFKVRKVIVYNAEDDLQEMHRRATAYMEFCAFTPQMRTLVEENLTLISGVANPMKLAEYRDGSVHVTRDNIDLLEFMMTENGVEVLVLDPLISLHSIPENANSEMAVLIAELKALIARVNAAMMLAHHDKKNISNRSIEEASQDDARGAGTITTPMRAIVNLKRLSAKDAERLRIPALTAKRVIALTLGSKSNYSPRDTSARLFFSNSVQADNATADYSADNTVALSVYQLPKVSTLITDEHRDAILAEIASGEYRSATQAIQPLVDFVTTCIGAEPGDETRKLTVAALKEWESKGWIAVEKKRDEHRKERPTYVRGPNTPPPPVSAFGAVEDEDED